MKTSVNIFVTCRKPELLPAALLVFRTLRIGFPTAAVNVFGNNLPRYADIAVYNAVKAIGGAYLNGKEMAHGEWIELLMQTMTRDFWICDSDVVFFDEVENWFERWDEVLFAGRYEPSFNCAWTQAEHQARLHPSLMWMNPGRLNSAVRAWPRRHPFFNTVERNLYRWHWVPHRDRVLEGDRGDVVRMKLYDTCSGLFHALGGTAFTEKQNATFGHLYSSTYLDLIGEHMPEEFRKVHEAVYKDPAEARKLWAAQQEFYKQVAAEVDQSLLTSATTSGKENG